jgi:hypothetical protein
MGLAEKLLEAAKDVPLSTLLKERISFQAAHEGRVLERSTGYSNDF